MKKIESARFLHNPLCRVSTLHSHGVASTIFGVGVGGITRCACLKMSLAYSHLGSTFELSRRFDRLAWLRSFFEAGP
jgi:hypothetical protein